ncbi:MAG: hypothetical protein ACYS9T_00515 [Planctomycetota bacterium]|jgi:hypothetical protein
MSSTAEPRIWLVPLVFLLLVGCKRSPAKRPPTVTSPISNNEYEFGVRRSLARSAWSKKEFCFLFHNPVHFRRVVLYKNNRLAFGDRGGFANGGLCWWHSRLTRSATYLTVYRPDLPKPTKKQVLKILDAYVNNSQVVEVPGYDNLQEFSSEWQDLFRKKLERWQLVEGIFHFGWKRGISGETEVSPEELKDEMDKLLKEVRTENRIVYQKLQVPGIRVHSWLVVDMKKTSDGYVLRIYDSTPNLFGTTPVKDVRYQIGDRYLQHRGVTFVPYTEFGNELEKIREAQLRYCHSK